MIVIGPDGTCKGENRLLAKHSFYVNSGCCGRFEDHVMHEVVPFVMSYYAVRQDKAGHALVGVSAGGMGAMALAIKYRDFFGSVAALAGVINLRYYNVQKDYFADFDPHTYRWRTEYYPREVSGVYAKGLLKIRSRLYIEPVWGTNPGVVARIARDNPADLLFREKLQPNELNMLVAYGGRDNLNLDAQGESFVWLARCCRGLEVDVRYYPEADHGLDFFRTSQRMAYGWLASKVEPPTTDEPM